MISTGLFQCNYSDSTKAVFQLELTELISYPLVLLEKDWLYTSAGQKQIPSISNLINNTV